MKCTIDLVRGLLIWGLLRTRPCTALVAVRSPVSLFSHSARLRARVCKSECWAIKGMVSGAGRAVTLHTNTQGRIEV